MVSGINHITLAVSNIERSFIFYKKIVGLKPLCKWDKGAYFLAGDIWFCLNLDEIISPKNDYTHIAFNVDDSEFHEINQKIINNQIPIFKANNSEGQSLYFLDPDGHKLEIHIGSWQTRLEAKQLGHGSWTNVEFYV